MTRLFTLHWRSGEASWARLGTYGWGLAWRPAKALLRFSERQGVTRTRVIRGTRFRLLRPTPQLDPSTRRLVEVAHARYQAAVDAHRVQVVRDGVDLPFAFDGWSAREREEAKDAWEWARRKRDLDAGLPLDRCFRPAAMGPPPRPVPPNLEAARSYLRHRHRLLEAMRSDSASHRLDEIEQLYRACPELRPAP